MSKLMSLDKQLEEKAKKWLLKQQQPQNRIMAKKFFEENKNEVIKDYLENNPKVKKEYIEKKVFLKKIKKGLLLGTLTAGTLAGVFIHKQKTQVQVELPKQEEQIGDDFIIEDEEKIDVEVKNEIEEETRKESNKVDQLEDESIYEDFFARVRSIDDRYNRDDIITAQTKEIIVEAYNKENPDNPITTERLQTFILNEFVLEKTDRLGNITYERVPQNVQYEFTDTQKLVKIGNIYDFRIDGKTVAVFDKNGNILPDKNVENPDMTFQNMVFMLDRSSDLKDVYKYPSNENEKCEAEEAYRLTANRIVNNDGNRDIMKELEQEK